MADVPFYIGKFGADFFEYDAPLTAWGYSTFCCGVCRLVKKGMWKKHPGRWGQPCSLAPFGGNYFAFHVLPTGPMRSYPL